ncbi:M23 family metallopeptidase [Clostridium rectalis]|uniref:M23 family metallopeptidase n=1 Tax=Clostridium rectalis TaxID=2040295 RepID=UPI000F645014|nr:M23 family metallopeptidase [Clostridium rectalis]
MFKKVKKIKIIILLSIIIFTTGFTIISIDKIYEYKANIETYNKIKELTNDEKNLYDAIIVKSDGKDIAILKSESEIKQLIDGVKQEYIKLNELSDNTSVKLKSKITYYRTKIYAEKIKGVKYYVSDIVGGSGDKWSIKFSYNSNINKEQATVVSRGAVSSGFGMRWGRMHNGIDLAAPMGTPIYAVLSGKVIFSGWQNGYGNVVKIDNGDNIVTIYGHCSKLFVKEGHTIEKGNKIAEVGSTGRSTGPHVHFEVRKNGVPQNPEGYLK